MLVTGGAGFLGASLVRKLVAEGHRVRVLDDGSRGSFRRLSDLEGRYEAVAGDVRDEPLLRQAATGCEVVYHLAAVNGTRFFYERPELVLDVALRGTLSAVTAARDAGTRRFLLASSSEVYHDPPVIPTPEDVRMVIPDAYNPRFSYAGGKIAAELIAIHGLKGTSTDCVIFRPHNVYGPAMGFEHVIPELVYKLFQAARWLEEPGRRAGSELLRQAGSSRPEQWPSLELSIQGSGEETRAFCFVDDAALAIALLKDRATAFTTYNVGREQESSIHDVATKVAAVLGFRARIVSGPGAAGAPSRRCPQMDRLRSLGFEARTTLDSGLEATVPWYWDAARRGEYPVGDPHDAADR